MRLAQASFHGPLSAARATRLIGRLTQGSPKTVLDIGCGWGEFLLQVLAATPGAEGVGIDLNTADLARAQTNADARGLAERVEFAEESGHETRRAPADLVLCLGASHALSDAPAPALYAEALKTLRRLVKPGGRVLWSEGFWERRPTEAEVARAWPGATAEDHTDLHGLAELAADAGFRVGWLETANSDEWEEFESAYLADREEWLASNADDDLKHEVDAHRRAWLTGYRNLLGMAHLTLIPVARADQ
jgi:SAM-dependent methyltransferase